MSNKNIKWCSKWVVNEKVPVISKTTRNQRLKIWQRYRTTEALLYCRWKCTMKNYFFMWVWYICVAFQFSSVAQSCSNHCDPMNRSTPGLPVHHQLLESTQIHVHRVSDAIQPSHPLSSPSPPAPNPSQHQSLFQWVNSSHEVAKLLEFQL